MSIKLLDIKIIAYKGDLRPMKTRRIGYHDLPDDSLYDKNGLKIENFNLPNNNLMFRDLVMANSPEEAIKLFS